MYLGSVELLILKMGLQFSTGPSVTVPADLRYFGRFSHGISGTIYMDPNFGTVYIQI